MIILGNNSAYAPDLFAGAISQGGGSDIPTTLGSRIDNKATVVGVLQDHEGNDYVLAVVDAAYRSEEPMAWSTVSEDTVLQKNPNPTEALNDHHSGKYNTDLILSTYTPTNYTAFNFARNACTVTLDGVSYYSVLPSINELQLLNNNKDSLDQYDPTVSLYPNRTMSGFTCGGSKGLWASTEQDSGNAFRYGGTTSPIGSRIKTNGSGCGVCPVICIPLS